MRYTAVIAAVIALVLVILMMSTPGASLHRWWFSIHLYHRP